MTQECNYSRGALDTAHPTRQNAPMQSTSSHDRIDGHLELWRGKFGGKYSFSAGVVSNKDNFEMACDVADEEMACLMAEVN